MKRDPARASTVCMRRESSKNCAMRSADHMRGQQLSAFLAAQAVRAAQLTWKIGQQNATNLRSAANEAKWRKRGDRDLSRANDRKGQKSKCRKENKRWAAQKQRGWGAVGEQAEHHTPLTPPPLSFFVFSAATATPYRPSNLSNLQSPISSVQGSDSTTGLPSCV